MADLAVRNLTRRFPSGGGVLDISLDVPSGEFVVLLGPSGCGKTTLLRMIAGLEYPDSGEIRIGAAGAGNTTHRESIAMVFQNFALYPHMTVFQNIAFPLKLRRIARNEIERRVKESAAKAGLAVDLRRHPRELSGENGNVSRLLELLCASRKSSSWTRRSRAWTRNCARHCGSS